MSERRPTWGAEKWLYPLMLVSAVLLFMVIRWRGEGLVAPPPIGEARLHAATASHAASNPLMHTLLALVVVLILARLLGAVFKRFHQPAVIGEVIAGIALGPSLLGRISPEAAAFVLPPSVAPNISVLAQVGVILYMFLVGLELDIDALRKQGHATIMISHASIVVPFVLGATMALGLYSTLSSSDVPFTVFALFVGVSMSVTAFPVLARILTDRGIQSSRLGIIALTCAAADDVTAWCLLAFVVSVAEAKIGGVVITTILTAVYIAFMMLVARPQIRKLVDRFGVDRMPTQTQIAIVCVGLLLSALSTEAIGIHALFGAFLLGAIIPHDSAIAKDFRRRLEDVVVVLFLPAFFAFTGMRTQIGLVSGASEWFTCGIIILVASLGKFGGSAAAARLSGYSWRMSSAIGILMNTRGLMELIVLNIGLDLGVLSPKLFAMLVIMAIVTTLMTTPVLALITREDEALVPGDRSRVAG
jgi:Kef-type K+ transport system membrane component KefB